MGKQMKFVMRTWYYDLTVTTPNGQHPQVYIDEGETIDSDHVGFGETGKHDGYIAGGYAVYVESNKPK